jgi:hypothetical protein
MQFRVQFVDASGTIIQEMHADAWNAAGAKALVEGMELPAGAVRMVILDAVGNEVIVNGRELIMMRFLPIGFVVVRR